MTEDKIKEGWGFGAGSQKAHYFREGLSLCRRWGFYYGPLEQGKDDSPDNCAACMKALAQRKAKVKQ